MIDADAEVAGSVRCEGCGRFDDPNAICLAGSIDIASLACGCISVNGQGHLPADGQPCKLMIVGGPRPESQVSTGVRAAGSLAATSQVDAGRRAADSQTDERTLEQRVAEAICDAACSHREDFNRCEVAAPIAIAVVEADVRERVARDIEAAMDHDPIYSIRSDRNIYLGLAARIARGVSS